MRFQLWKKSKTNLISFVEFFKSLMPHGIYSGLMVSFPFNIRFTNIKLWSSFSWRL